MTASRFRSSASRFLGRDIAKNHDQAGDLACFAKGRGAIDDVEKSAILANENIFLIGQGDTAGQHTQTGAFRGGEGRAIRVLVVGDIMHFASAQFIESPAEEFFRGGIHGSDETAGVDGVKTFAHVLHDGVVEILPLPESGIGLFDFKLPAALILDEIADLVLAAAGTQGDLDGTPKGRGAHGPLEERDTAGGGGGEITKLEETGFATAGEKDEGKFRPGGLRLESFQQDGDIRIFQGLLGEQERPGSQIDFPRTFVQSLADFWFEAVLTQQRRHGDGIVADGSHDQDAFL